MKRQQHIAGKLKALASLALLALLTSCSTLPQPVASLNGEPQFTGAIPTGAPAAAPALMPAALTTGSPAAPPQSQELAYVVISAGQKLKGGLGPRRTAIASQWTLTPAPVQPDATTVVLTADDESSPYVTQVRAGRYELRSFAFGVGGQLYSSASGLSLAEFTVAPGEVLYVGHLLVKTKTGLLGTLRNDFQLAVENHEKRARAQLKKLEPELAERLQTRLITLSPMLQRLSQAPH